MEVECDAFADLYSIWDLICKMYLEAVMACQRTPPTPAAEDTHCPASGGVTAGYSHISKHVQRDLRCLLFYTVSKHFPHSLVGVPPPCCKHADDDLSRDTTHRTRPIHPSIHSSSPRCRCCLHLGMCASSAAATSLLSVTAADSFQTMFTVETLHKDSHIVWKTPLQFKNL